MSATLFVNAAQCVTCAGPGRARRGHEMKDAGVRDNTGIAIVGQHIAALDTDENLRRAFPYATEVDCNRGLLAPGFVDSHTHAVFGRARYEEQELRATGVPYLEIAKRGGGIHSSVRDLRGRTNEELYALAVPRLKRLAAGGVTTVEIKSGYGLTVHDELRTLQVIRDLDNTLPLNIVATCLGAHEVPFERRDLPDGRASWIRELITELFPAVVEERLAQFADIFCEPGVFDLEESRLVLEGARAAGMDLKLHADELHDGGGAALGVTLGATSVDHLAAIASSGIRALSDSQTVATLLPATMLFLGTGRQAPARKLLESGAAVALATDFNPGTSPLTSFPLLLTLAVSELRMSASEAWLAGTVNGAAALGQATTTGQLAVGYYADVAVHDASDFRELPYWFGERLCRGTWVRGSLCHPHM
ncbi:MAG: imidazolonepropionase [Phycisphaerae bacterium]|nr:imidazolonepropionase [Gemmatimonadaceae bacterium]